MNLLVKVIYITFNCSRGKHTFVESRPFYVSFLDCTNFIECKHCGVLYEFDGLIA